jgi:lysophospholipase L1-like esterase
VEDLGLSDPFHPSPRGHELLAATVNRALVREPAGADADVTGG